eukprot:4520704-Amphidinium_carterae.2
MTSWRSSKETSSPSSLAGDVGTSSSEDLTASTSSGTRRTNQSSCGKMVSTKTTVGMAKRCDQVVECPSSVRTSEKLPELSSTSIVGIYGASNPTYGLGYGQQYSSGAHDNDKPEQRTAVASDRWTSNGTTLPRSVGRVGEGDPHCISTQIPHCISTQIIS